MSHERVFHVFSRSAAKFAALVLAFVITLLGHASASVLDFTPEEKAWLATNPELRVSADPQWPPYSMIDAAGKLTGIDADMLDLIAQRTGLRFTVVRADTWAAAEALGREGKVDVLTGTAMTPQRLTFAKFTQPYVPSVAAIITRRGDISLTSLRMLEGHKVAVAREHIIARNLAEDYPLVQIMHTDTQTEAFRKVEDGEADATVANLTGANYTILNESLGGLHIAGITDYAFDIRLAVIASGPALGVLEKALASISRRERTAITDRWTGLEFQRAAVRRTAWKVLEWTAAIAGAILLVLLIRNRAIARELAERRKVERALFSANQSLRTAAEEKSGLMQMLSHDLRGPLTCLTGLCDLFEMQPSSDARLRGDLQIMRASVDRMTRLVTGLLSADAIETGMRKFKLQGLDLVATSQKVIQRLTTSAAAKNIALHFVNREPCRVLADELALEQVVENLVSNAVKFTPSGGRVDVSVHPAGGKVELRVADTGPGVNEQDREKLFKKFSRLTAQPTGGESSFGLGLMLVKRMVEAMDGAIRHESGKESGSVFIVELKA